MLTCTKVQYTVYTGDWWTVDKMLVTVNYLVQVSGTVLVLQC